MHLAHVLPQVNALRSRLRTVAVCLALASLAPAAPAAGDPAIHVSGASCQRVSDMGVVYLTVLNHGSRPDRLMSVRTEAAKSTQMHESIKDGDVVRMRELAHGVVVPARGSVRFEPGGKHIMLMDLAPDAQGAQSIDLQLRFRSAGVIRVQAPVRPMGE
jgi:hypothetical protein